MFCDWLDVSARLAIDDFELTNFTTGNRVALSSSALAYDRAANRARLSFASLPGGKLDQGQSQLVLAARGVFNDQGIPLAEDFIGEFSGLVGDTNNDRMTNDLDLYRVWQNLLKPAAARNLNEDLTGDGQVNVDDVTVVKGNYLSSLSMPGRASLGSFAWPVSSPTGDWDRLFSSRDEILGRTISLKTSDQPAEAAFFLPRFRSRSPSPCA